MHLSEPLDCVLQDTSVDVLLVDDERHAPYADWNHKVEMASAVFDCLCHCCFEQRHVVQVATSWQTEFDEYR